MCMVVLRPWTNYRALVVIVILITDIPIEPVMQLNREPRFRRLITHRIRGDQRSRSTCRIGQATSLAVVLIYSIRCEQRCPGSDVRDRLDIEKIVPHEIETIAHWMLYAVEEVVDYGLLFIQ